MVALFPFFTIESFQISTAFNLSIERLILFHMCLSTQYSSMQAPPISITFTLSNSLEKITAILREYAASRLNWVCPLDYVLSIKIEVLY